MKTKEEILSSEYMTANDLKTIIPTMGIERCRKYIDEVRKEMAEKNYIVPKTQPRVALTSMMKKYFGWK